MSELNELSDAVKQLAYAHKVEAEAVAAVDEINDAIREKYGEARRRQLDRLLAAREEIKGAEEWVKSRARRAHYANFATRGHTKPHPAVTILAVTTEVSIVRDLSAWLPGGEGDDG